MPAGRPWRVIRISSSAATRKYRERSSFTSARGTARVWLAVLREPRLGLAFRDDGEDLDRFVRDVIEHPGFVNAQPELGPAQPPKALDAALADLGRFVAQVPLDAVPDLRAVMSREPIQLADGARCEDDLVAHSGQNIARLLTGDKRKLFERGFEAV